MAEPRRTLLAVHAHPDDESSSTGGTLLRYGEAGVRTVVVTCTGGEVGEISDPALATPETLREVRAAELDEALRILGVSRSIRLGYRDSGMAGTPDNDHPASFHQADLTEAVGRLVAVIREERPQVVIGYDEQGGYGHPDHIRVNQITDAAFAAAGDPDRYPEAGPPWAPQKLYYTAFPVSMIRRFLEVMQEMGLELPIQLDELTAGETVTFGTPDERVTTVIDVSKYVDRKRQALFTHRTQIGPDNPWMLLSPDRVPDFWGFEHFTRVIGPAGGRPGRETDLFAGIENPAG